MLRNATLFVAVLASLATLACNGNDEPNPIQVAFAQRPPPSGVGPAVAFLFPEAANRPIRLFQLPSLEELTWRFDEDQYPTQSIVGYSSDEDHIYFEAPGDNLFALDLSSGRRRTIDTMTAQAVIGPTGVPFTSREDSTVGPVVDRRLEVWPFHLPALPDRILGAPRDRLVAIFEGGDHARYAVLTDKWDGTLRDLPPGRVIASPWADLLLVLSDSALIGVRVLNPDSRLTFRLDEPATDVGLSASAHRVYVLTSPTSLQAIDRFDFIPLYETSLTHPYSALRSDGDGRFLFALRADTDSIGLLDPGNAALVATIPGRFTDDLPRASHTGIVLTRAGDDVIAIDPATGEETGRVAEPVGSWILVPWDARRPTLQLAAEAGASVGQLGDRVFYAQLSSTANLAWASERVEDLVGAGLPARIVMPSEFEDRYRVVLGPYRSHDEAENNARQLGQSYFVISFDRSDTTLTFR